MFNPNSEIFSIWNKKAFLQLEKPQLQEVILSKPNRILTAIHGLYGVDYNPDVFLRRDTCVSSMQLSINIGTNLGYLQLH